MKYNLGDQVISVGDQEIKVRIWTSKEERSFLSQKAGSYSLSEIVQAMILPNIEYKPMTLDEFKYLVFKLRGLSVAPEVNYSYTCNGTLHIDPATGDRIKANDERLNDEEFSKTLFTTPCRDRIDTHCNIDEVVKFVPSTLKDGFTIEVEDVKIKMRKIPTKELLLRVLNETDISEQNYIEFLACVKEVQYDGETMESFTFDEVKEFFDSVPGPIFKKIYKQFYDVKGSIEFNISDDCPSCGTRNRIFFNDILEFL